MTTEVRRTTATGEPLAELSDNELVRPNPHESEISSTGEFTVLFVDDSPREQDGHISKPSTAPERIFGGDIVPYLRPDLQRFYARQEEKLVYFTALGKLVKYLTAKRKAPHRLAVVVGGIGTGNEIQFAFNEIAKEQGDRFGIVGIDYSPKVIENIKDRATKQGWSTVVDVAHADLTKPHTFWDTIRGEEYRKGKPAILTTYSSMLHEARENDTSVLQYTLDNTADGGGIFIREFEPTGRGRVKVRLKSADSRRFYSHFIKHWDLNKGEEIYTSSDWHRWETEDGSQNAEGNEIEMTERLGREFWLHYRNWRKNVKALSNVHKLEDIYADIHNWHELKEGYVNHRDSANGIAGFAESLTSELVLRETDELFTYAITVRDISDDINSRMAEHVEILENIDDNWVKSARLNETRRMWMYLHKVPKDRKDEFPIPWDTDDGMRMFHEHLALPEEDTLPEERIQMLAERVRASSTVIWNIDTVGITFEPSYLQNLTHRIVQDRFRPDASIPADIVEHINNISTFADLDRFAWGLFPDEPWKFYEKIDEIEPIEKRLHHAQISKSFLHVIGLLDRDGKKNRFISQLSRSWLDGIIEKVQTAYGDNPITIDRSVSRDETPDRKIFPHPSLLEESTDTVTEESTLYVDALGNGIGASQPLRVIPIYVQRPLNGHYKPLGDYLTIVGVSQLADAMELEYD